MQGFDGGDEEEGDRRFEHRAPAPASQLSRLCQLRDTPTVAAVNDIAGRSCERALNGTQGVTHREKGAAMKRRLISLYLTLGTLAMIVAPIAEAGGRHW